MRGRGVPVAHVLARGGTPENFFLNWLVSLTGSKKFCHTLPQFFGDFSEISQAENTLPCRTTNKRAVAKFATAPFRYCRSSLLSHTLENQTRLRENAYTRKRVPGIRCRPGLLNRYTRAAGSCCFWHYICSRNCFRLGRAHNFARSGRFH